MTQYQNACCPYCNKPLPDAELTNYFDLLLKGIGHRGSSFSDLDFFQGRLRLRVTHDGQTHRFLAMEFKYWRQLPLNPAQAWLMSDLARVPEFTVWLIAKRDDGRLGWINFRLINDPNDMPQPAVISEGQCQSLYRQWWNRERNEIAAEEADAL